MRPRPKVPPVRAWVITELGRDAAERAEFCACDVKLTGILFTCPDCDTVYGSIKEATKPRAQRWNYGRGR
jgi:hypothetical protein